MTASEARQVFGDSFSCTYFNGTDYVSGTFTYDSYNTWSPNSVSSSDGSFTYEGTVWLQYTATLSGLNTNPNYITVDLSPLYSIFDTTQIHTCIALSSSSTISTVYQSPAWDWMYAGTSYHIENSDTDTSGNYHAYFTHSSFNLTYVCVDLTSQSLASGYSSRAVFYGNGGISPMRLYIGVPYVDNGASGQTGSFPVTTSGSGSGSGVDMGPTNTILEEQTGLLQQIKQGIQGFFDTIKNALVSVFVPSSDFMDDFKADMQDLLEDHLGGLYQAISKIDDIFSGFGTVTSKQTLHINAVEIPLAGETLTLGNWDVPLKRNELSILYDGIAFIIDFLATAAFLNMCRNKLEIFLNPDSEVIAE